MTLLVEDLKFILNSLGTYWNIMPEKDKYAMLNIWRGYTLISADILAQAYQLDYNKSLRDIQSTFTRLWHKYQIWNYYDLTYSPDFSYNGLADEIFDWDDNNEELNCTFNVHGAWDKAYLTLRSEIDNYANLYWQTNMKTTSSIGAGGLIGYFNKYSKDVTNTIAFGWSDGKIIGMIVDSDGILHVEQSIPFMEKDKDYAITGTYLASGGELTVQCYEDTVLQQMLTIGISTISFDASGIPSGLPSGGFSCDQFGIANLNNIGNVDTFKSITTNSTGTAIIKDIGYMDPSLEYSVQSIPTLQTEQDYPLLTLTQGVDKDYFIINSELYFHDIMPAKYLWAKRVLHDNDDVENRFGAPVRYRRGTDTHQHITEEYLNGVKGLWHSYLYGPTVVNIETGLSILAREPFAQKAGIVGAINPTYTDTHGTITIIPTDGSPNQSYPYRRSIGLAENPSTLATIKVGDAIGQFQVLTDALDVVDYKNEPDWWRYHLLTEATQVQRFKSFGVKLKPLALSANSLSLMASNFINHIKPADTRVWFLREDTTPLFVVDSYGHNSYIDVNISGDQNIYLPADFVFEDRDEPYLYNVGLSSLIFNTPDSDPSGNIIPILNVYPAFVVTIPNYAPTLAGIVTSDIAFLPGFGSDVIMYAFEDAVFSYNIESEVWTRIKEIDGMTPASFMNNRFILPRKGIVSSALASIIIWATASGLMMSSCGETDITREGSYTNSSINLDYDEAIASSISDDGAKNLLVGTNSTDSSEILIYDGDLSINRQDFLFTQPTNDFYVTVKDFSSFDNVAIPFYLDQAADGATITLSLRRKWGNTTGQLYADLYQGSHVPMPSSTISSAPTSTSPNSSSPYSGTSFWVHEQVDGLKIDLQLRGSGVSADIIKMDLYSGFLGKYGTYRGTQQFISTSADTYTQGDLPWPGFTPFTFNFPGTFAPGLYTFYWYRSPGAFDSNIYNAEGIILTNTESVVVRMAPDKDTIISINQYVTTAYDVSPINGSWTPIYLVETSSTYIDNISGEYLGYIQKDIPFTFSSVLPKGPYTIVLRREGGFSEYNIYGAIPRTWDATNTFHRPVGLLPEGGVDGAITYTWSPSYDDFNLGNRSVGETQLIAQTIDITTRSCGFRLTLAGRRINSNSGYPNLNVSLYQGIPGESATLLETRVIISNQINRLTVQASYTVFNTELVPTNSYFVTIEVPVGYGSSTEYYIFNGKNTGSYVGGYMRRKEYDSSLVPQWVAAEPNADLIFNLETFKYHPLWGTHGQTFLPYIEVIAPLHFPNAYASYSLASTITNPYADTPSDSIKLDLYENSGAWRLFIYTQSYGTAYIYTSTDSGSTWTSYSLIPSVHQTNIIGSRYFYDSRGNIYYYYKTGQDKDYVIVTSNAGFYWSTPKSLNDDGYTFSSKVRPSFTEDESGIVWLLGVSKSGSQLLSRRMMAGAL